MQPQEYKIRSQLTREAIFHLVTLITVIQETHQIDISTKVTSKEEIIMEAAAILGMKTA